MIRTLIEITSEDDFDHRRKLEYALGLIGYEPKPSEDSVRYRADLFRELDDRGLDPMELVKAQRAKRQVIGTS